MTYEAGQVYVDALGKTGPYEAYLSSLFPDISFTVTAKADQKFKIVGAASVAAKVTRDAWLEGWVYEEHAPTLVPSKYFGGSTHDAAAAETKSTGAKWVEETGSGYPSGELVVSPFQRTPRLVLMSIALCRSKDPSMDQELS